MVAFSDNQGDNVSSPPSEKNRTCEKAHQRIFFFKQTGPLLPDGRCQAPLLGRDGRGSRRRATICRRRTLFSPVPDRRRLLPARRPGDGPAHIRLRKKGTLLFFAKASVFAVALTPLLPPLSFQLTKGGV